MAEMFTVDDTLFRAQAKKLVRKLEIDEPKFLKEEAGILAQLLAKATPPFTQFPRMSGSPTYTTGSARKQGELAVRVDFNRSIKRMGSIRRWKNKSIQNAIRAGDTEKLRAILRNMKKSNKYNLPVERYSERLRNRKRNNRGRVTPSASPVVAITDADVNAGLKAAVRSVGIAKAAFAKAARRLGRPLPPSWISRHFSKINTTVVLRKSPARVSFTASAKGLDVTSSRIRSAERFRLRAMVIKLERMVKAESKKKGFRVT